MLFTLVHAAEHVADPPAELAGDCMGAVVPKNHCLTMVAHTGLCFRES